MKSKARYFETWLLPYLKVEPLCDTTFFENMFFPNSKGGATLRYSVAIRLRKEPSKVLASIYLGSITQ